MTVCVSISHKGYVYPCILSDAVCTQGKCPMWDRCYPKPDNIER